MADRASDVQLIRPYVTSQGTGAEFRVGRHRDVRFETRADGIFVAWPAERDFGATALRLGQLARGAEVHLIHGGHLDRPRQRGKRLARLLRRLPNVELVRIDREADTVVWEDSAEHGREIAVLSESAQTAERLCAEAGAEDVGRRLPLLVELVTDAQD